LGSSSKYSFSNFFKLGSIDNVPLDDIPLDDALLVVVDVPLDDVPLPEFLLFVR
jgi:hypothetical protein